MKKLLIFAAVIAVSFTTFAQVGIGTTTPNASAALDVTSTTQGLLPPRMTKLQLEAIESPIEGLMVYCTDCVPKTLYVFDAFNFVSFSNNTPSGLSSTDVYSATGKTWMDRNLGATMVSNQPKSAFTSDADYKASQEDSFGDLYQWGRNTDGHQIRTSTTAAGPVASGNEGANFIKITSTGTTRDWLTFKDDTRWNGSTKGTHDPCPAGYRVPTATELEAELNNGGDGFWGTGSEQYNPAGAFASVLKLPLAGYRHDSNGELDTEDSRGRYWSSTVSGTRARNLYFRSGNATMSNSYRANGFSVRCIKD